MGGRSLWVWKRLGHRLCPPRRSSRRELGKRHAERASHPHVASCLRSHDDFCHAFLESLGRSHQLYGYTCRSWRDLHNSVGKLSMDRYRRRDNGGSDDQGDTYSYTVTASNSIGSSVSTSLYVTIPTTASVYPEIAFQANSTSLYLAGTGGSGSQSAEDMAAGTSPSVAALSTGGFEEAYQSSSGSLSTIGSAGNTQLGVRCRWPAPVQALQLYLVAATRSAFESNTGRSVDCAVLVWVLH